MMKFFLLLSRINKYIIFIVFLCGLYAYSQTPMQELNLAKSLERNQEYEEALKLYKKLEVNNQIRESSIQGIQNCLKGLMRYEELTIYLEKIVVENPTNNKYIIALAEAHLLNSQKDNALKIWKTLLTKSKNNMRIYRMVASSMLKHRLINEAIEVYKLALANIKNQQILHLDIANLYKSILDMENAAQHYIDYYGKFPKQKSFLERQLLSLTKSDQYANAVAKVLNNNIDTDKNNIVLKEILGGLYIKSKKFDLAYDLYKSLDLAKNDGRQLFKFGKEAQKNNAYDYAIKAFTAILEKEPKAIYDLTYFELANTYYNKSFETNISNNTDERRASLEKAIQMFEHLVSKEKVKSFSDLSCEILGDIYLSFYFDLDKTAYYYEKLLSKYPKSKRFSETQIKLGDVYLKKGNIKKSHVTYSNIQDKNKFSIKTFKLAELEYYQGKFSKALKNYNLIIEKKGPADSLANNVLEKTIFINTFLSDTLNLIKYAESELLIFQNKYTEAIEYLNKIVIKKTDISVKAGKKVVELLIKLKKYQEANITLNEIIRDYPDDYLIDEFIFRSATLEDILGNAEKSLELYQKLLNNYETSLYYEQARENARIISEKIKLKQVSG